VPVTAKLSKEFYEKFGDSVANQLVEWFNLVDAQSRTDLRELLDSRLREVRTEVRADLDGFEARMGARMEQQEGRILARMEQMIAKEHRTQLRWTVGLWLSTILTVVVARVV
jgi:hypothetical protein